MTHAEIIAALGGPDALARLLKVHRTRPPRWGRGEGIPTRHWGAIIEVARRDGLDAITWDTLHAGASHVASTPVPAAEAA